MDLDHFWAKTDQQGLPALSVRDHCLIVGAVSEAAAARLAEPVRNLLPKGTATLVAAHDLGKITPGFQLQCPRWKHYPDLAGTILENGLEIRHATVSAWHLAYGDHPLLPGPARGWLVSTLGHHGSYDFGFQIPLGRPFEGIENATGIHPIFSGLRDELLAILTETFGPLPDEPAQHQEIRAHLLTGFTIFADWIGSNPDWFPLDTPVDRSAIAEQTSRILTSFGHPVNVRPDLSFGQLFSPEAPDQFAPRPLQKALLEAADHPGLYIIEAPMGMGKTEAALAAAYRRWTEGSERGLYFALPTQLTSAKIHERIEVFLGSILDAPAFQSLIHGNAWLSDDRNRQVGPGDEEHNDTDEALRWFSSTRRQLLAPFGTGTIDQALLAILPARFAALRYFGLAGKVVVIDEVHAYDPYMSTLIDRLVEYLLPTGATVIILSATLTAARRAELVAAAGASETPPPDAYPLITKVATGTQSATHLPFADLAPPKTIHLHHQTLTPENASTYWQSIADYVTAGANVVVIRNTVALAQETYRLLKSKLDDSIPGEHTGLLHSRFTHRDRQTNEGEWIRRLGKDPTERPRGSLLVATQIVEQSVDIDADLLVTDLAPVELILQRIGRLHRHPHERPTGFEQPRCHILHPRVDWQADAETIEGSLAPHHFIYPPLALWQAAQILEDRPFITLPTDIRTLLEAAARKYPEPGLSRALGQFRIEDDNRRDCQRGTAQIRHPFATAIDDKEGTETRYQIQPTAHLVLVSSRPEERDGVVTIHPRCGDPVSVRRGLFSYPFARALHENAVRIPAYLVRDALSAGPDWLRQHLSDGLLAFSRPDRSELEILTDRVLNHAFECTTKLGLTWRKVREDTARFQTEPEDFWF